MATLANAVDPGAFANLVFASLVETARNKPAKQRGSEPAYGRRNLIYSAHG